MQILIHRTQATRFTVCLLTLLLLQLASCGGGSGGGNGATPSGLATSLVAVSVHSSAPLNTCPNSGVTVDSGKDSNGNKKLDASEVTSTQYVCKGSGLTALVRVSSEAAGVNCASGGAKVSAGLDTNGNNILDPSEVTTFAYICNGTNGTNGSNGSNGLNSLVSIEPEPVGKFCTYGGNKVSSGLDTNANGVLDLTEITSSSYVCNGAPGTNGTNGTNGTGITWVDVTGTSQKAVSNTGYMADNAAQVTITLPDTPVLGDLLQISGIGTGGWKVAQNAGQHIITTDLVGGIGATWTPRDSARRWSSVASSADGMKLIAADGYGAGGYLYTSTDAGVTWTPSGPSDKFLNLIPNIWYSVATSSDGTKLVAAVYGGQLYTSSDSGATWIAQMTDTNRNWVSVASSADGTRLVAAEYYGTLYTSTDSGKTWIAQMTDATRYWISVASSADGTKLVAGGFGQLYTSMDSGATWTASNIPYGRWSVASSSDGTKIIAAAHGHQIYISIDGGVTWMAHGPSGNWISAASSADATKLIVSGTGPLYTSNDAGTTWTARRIGTWSSVASSADGTKLIAADAGGAGGGGGGYLYTSSASTTPGVAGSITGGQYDALDLQCIGNNTFMVRGYAGILSVQ